MGNKMDHASGSRDALDLSVADPADSPILDDQTVSDTLETGAFHLSDHSTGDGQDDADTFAPYDETMNTLKLREYMIKLRPEAEERETETIDSETLLATSRIKRSPFVKTSWTQRVLSWFRRD